LKVFRKYIKITPAILIWLWLGIFFADAANLDDLWANNALVIHTDSPSCSAKETANCSMESVKWDNSKHPFQKAFCLKQMSHSKTVYDQDSPSLIPEIQSINKISVSNLLIKKFILSSVSITKFLYLEQRSLLI
jgi:hypothetical protein